MVWEIQKGVKSVGVQDWDRRLFDELIPLPDGTSYNAYVVQGTEKTALIDTVDPPFAKELLENLKTAGVKTLDYIIPNHAEQDHSGSIPEVLKQYPNAKVVTNEKCKEMLKDLLHMQEDKFQTVADGQTLELGDKTLKFIMAPWVHWPETMLTLLEEDKILFSCDLFGSHLATSDNYAKDDEKTLQSAKRYYAEIMMPFRNLIKGHMEKIKTLYSNKGATSYGPIYYKPDIILNAYRQWISDEVKNEVVIPYVSMHGSTKTMVDHLVNAIEEKGITVKPYDLAKTDIGELAMALVDAATIIVGTPTVLGGPHPSAVYAAYLTNALRPKTRFASVVGSYSWGGRTVEQIKQMLPNLKIELLEPVMEKGHPTQETYKKIDILAQQILKKHQEHNIILQR